MNQFLKAALEYATFGWAVFPLVPGQKIPITKHGVKDATKDAGQIRAWWEKWPDANVAVACGAASGVYVIDVDVAESGNVNGYNSLKEFPDLPRTVTQNTPRGGFHAFYCTDDPPANKNSFRPGIDIRGDGYYVVVVPSIHPNGGTYKWQACSSPWEGEIAEFPDFMRPAKRSPWCKAPSIPAVDFLVPMAPIGSPASDRQLQRASAWLATCEPAVQGQGGHDKLFWAASSIMYKFGLSNNQVLDLLIREYNPSCRPPWDLSDPKDEKDFRRKVNEARKNPPAIAAQWAQEAALEREEVSQEVRDGAKQLLNAHLTEGFVPDIETVNASMEAIKQGNVKSITECLQQAELRNFYSPPGLVGEICEWINDTAICKQPFLTLACSLAFCGALFGRKVRDSIGTRTNLYCMGVADSSAGKNWPPNQIRTLCAAAGCEDLLGGDTAASDSAIEERLSRRPATLFLWDEIGFLLRSIKQQNNPHTAGIVSLLMRLHSASGTTFTGREYADADRQRIITQPCCCIYGNSSSVRFTEGISAIELQDGWLSRCLVFRVHNTPRKNRSKCDAPPPKSLCDQVDAWFSRQIQPSGAGDIGAHAVFRGSSGDAASAAPTQLIVPRTKAAERKFITFDDEAHKLAKGTPEVASLWLRAEENARKIGLIIAAGLDFDRPEITESTADYSCRLMRHLLLSFMHDTVPEIVSSRVDLQKQKFLKIIKRHKIDGCPYRELSRASQHINTNERAALLNDMQDAGIIVAQKEGKTFRYWTAEYYLKNLKRQ